MKRPTDWHPRLALGWVYGIQCGEFIKIGVAKNVDARLETMRLYNPHPCLLVFKKRTVAPYFYEQKLHELLAEHAVGREWFKIDVAAIKGHAPHAWAYAKHEMSRIERRVFDEQFDSRQSLANQLAASVKEVINRSKGASA